MRDARAGLAAVGWLAILALPGRSEAQAVGFAPTVGSAADGVGLGVTPAVSADRRHVRLSIGSGFQAVDGFQEFPVPAAVGGGGGGGRGIGVVTGMNGPIGPAIPGMDGPDDHGFGGGYFEDLGPLRPRPRRARVARPRAVRAGKAAPDVAIAAPKAKAKP